jgi:hypothetical protein
METGEWSGYPANEKRETGHSWPSVTTNNETMCTLRLLAVDWADTPRRFEWTGPFLWKTKSSLCSCAITFQSQSTSGCIHRYFAHVSVVCDVMGLNVQLFVMWWDWMHSCLWCDGTECIAVHMELVILFCWSVLKFPLCCALGHTVGPWLMNSIRSRGLVVTQVGRKSRLFFP